MTRSSQGAPILVGRCSLHGVTSDPVGEVIGTLRSGERRDFDEATVLAYFAAARDPYQLRRIQDALDEHEGRSSR